MKIGILGASGFIGNRAVEMLADQGYEVYPIVRAQSSVSRLTRSDLEIRFANALDQAALTQAFTNCEIVIHSVLGSPGLIRSSIAPAYRAAQKAGVRRLIYLSSMCVHGQAPAPGTTEATPLNPRQPFPYNSAKIAAEQKLQQLRKRGTVEVVIFRPGIVFGPRSRWIINLANELLEGRAYLLNGGEAICNTVYVDNLVQGMSQAICIPEADGEAFFVGDTEQVTWAEFYRPFAIALGVNPSQIHYVNPPTFTITRNWKKHLSSAIRDSMLMQKLLASISDDFKQILKNRLSKPSSSIPPLSRGVPSTQPKVSSEMTALQACQYKLPLNKAKQLLSYQPAISFSDACQYCFDWLETEGYPVNQVELDNITDHKSK